MYSLFQKKKTISPNDHLSCIVLQVMTDICRIVKIKTDKKMVSFSGCCQINAGTFPASFKIGTVW